MVPASPQQHVCPAIANVAAVTFPFIYVAGFYIFLDEKSAKLSRNHPVIIRNRIRSVIFASIIAPILVWLIVPFDSLNYSIFQALGLSLPSSVPELVALTRPVVLTVILFLGPLVQLFFEQSLPFQSSFDFGRDVKDVFLSLLGQRNYVVAPITEEFVFRACMIAILYHAGWSLTSLVFISPMYFGLAHLHHAWEKYHQWGASAKALKLAVISSLFQFCYTTVFGWYVSFVFMRLGSIWPPIVCHTFCNIMGFPDISEIQLQAPAKRAVIMSSFVLGVVLFYWLLYPFTEPLKVDGSLYWPAASEHT